MGLLSGGWHLAYLNNLHAKANSKAIFSDSEINRFTAGTAMSESCFTIQLVNCADR